MRRHPLEIVAEWLAELEVDLAAALRAETNDQQGVIRAFEAAKEQAKGNFKRLAFEHHPDRGGDENRFKRITEVWNRLQKVEVRPRYQPVTSIKFTVTVNPWEDSTTTVTGWYWP